MKDLQKQLKSMSKSLAQLAEQIETVAAYIEKFDSLVAPVEEAPVEAAPVEEKKKAPAKTKAAAKKAAPKARAAKKAAPKAKEKVEEAPVEAVEASSKSSSVLATVYDVIKRSRKGVNIAKIKEKTGFEARQISNALYKLSKKGQIKSMARGVYAKA